MDYKHTAATGTHPVKKTLKDCASCPCVTICDAHVTGGSWPHRGGSAPCEVTYE